MDKFFYLLVIAFMTCGVTVNAQTVATDQGVEMTIGQDKFQAPIQLTTDAMDLRHCSDNHLQFLLRLNFTNEGKGSVILDKRSSVISKYMVSRNSESAARKKYEIVVSPLIGLEAAGMTLSELPDESQFVVLKPGESYRVDRVFNFHNRANSNDQGFLRDGAHALQIVVLTWYYPRASNVEWRKLWQAKGYLWSDSITSVAMPFRVEVNLQLETAIQSRGNTP